MTQHQNVAILFSHQSREIYIKEANELKATYTYINARGEERQWLKGEYAYLAVNAASACLLRCNIKHDIVEELVLRKVMSAYHTLLIPNAGSLETDTITALQEWLINPKNRLIVTGKTNLPATILGLEKLALFKPNGFSGWRWTKNSKFADLRTWGEFYVSSYDGYGAMAAMAMPNARVLAELYAFSGDLQTTSTATKKPIGDGIVLTKQTLFVANQLFEFLGGAMQAQMDVDAIRNWYNTLHWGDTLLYFLWEILLDWHPEIATFRLRSFGTYNGVYSLRHDVDKSSDTTMLDYEVQHMVSATHNILDPVISADSATREEAEIWVRETNKYEFLEASLHNDSIVKYITGKGFVEHVHKSEENLGVKLYTTGRHGSLHVHPETIDAMDYLYENCPDIVGMCSFSFYNMIEYGVRNPNLEVMGEKITYSSSGEITIATSGFWFPFHPVLATVEEHKVLRGWDRTHEYDSDYDQIDAIFEANHSLADHPAPRAVPTPPPWELSATDAGEMSLAFDQLENGVYCIQYHPIFTRDPLLNNGKGTLDNFIYSIRLAERKNLWLASEQWVYERLHDYESLSLRINSPSSITIYNPTNRKIEKMMVEHNYPVAGVSDGKLNYIHLVNGRFFTIPPLSANQSIILLLEDEPENCPRICQQNSKGLEILNATYDAAIELTVVEVSIIGDHGLAISNMLPDHSYQITINQEGEIIQFSTSSQLTKILSLTLNGPSNQYSRQRIEISPK